jgi:hypothetical protein
MEESEQLTGLGWDLETAASSSTLNLSTIHSADSALLNSRVSDLVAHHVSSLGSLAPVDLDVVETEQYSHPWINRASSQSSSVVQRATSDSEDIYVPPWSPSVIPLPSWVEAGMGYWLEEPQVHYPYYFTQSPLRLTPEAKYPAESGQRVFSYDEVQSLFSRYFSSGVVSAAAPQLNEHEHFASHHIFQPHVLQNLIASGPMVLPSSGWESYISDGERSPVYSHDW